MAVEVQMPKLGLTMQEGTVAEWLVADGTEVSPGTPVMLISTDKVETEWEIDQSGILRHAVPPGETLECGELVGWLVAEGEEPPAAPERSAAGAASSAAPPMPAPAVSAPASGPTTSPAGVAARGEGGRLLASPNARRVAAERGIDLSHIAGTGPGGRITSEDVIAARVAPPAPAPAVATADGSGRFVPLVARKAAERLGVDLAGVVGSGPDGRVTRRDVYEAVRVAEPWAVSSAAPALAPGPPDGGPQPGDVLPLSGMRGVIAERMHTSLQEAAQLTLGVDVDMARVVELREQLKEIGADALGTVPGFTDFVIGACARALRQHPLANASIVDGAIQVLPAVNVGMAVAVPDGLIVPVVRGADQLSLLDLAVETRRLAAAARDGQLGLADLEGGTFSVSALGMFDVDFFTPVINPPNAAILGVGRIRDEVRWLDDTPQRGRAMTISLTWDHRILDGAPAAEFAATIRRYLEEPLRLMA